MNLQEFAEKAIQLQIGDGTENTMAHVLAMDANNELTCIAIDMGSDSMKDVLVTALRAMFWWKGVTQYAFTSEAWIASMKPDDAPDPRPPSERPDKREGIIVQAEDLSGDFAMGTAFVTAMADGPRKVGNVEWMEKEGVSTGGRFSGLLKNMPQSEPSPAVVALCEAQFGPRLRRKQH